MLGLSYVIYLSYHCYILCFCVMLQVVSSPELQVVSSLVSYIIHDLNIVTKHIQCMIHFLLASRMNRSGTAEMPALDPEEPLVTFTQLEQLLPDICPLFFPK